MDFSGECRIGPAYLRCAQTGGNAGAPLGLPIFQEQQISSDRFVTYPLQRTAHRLGAGSALSSMVR
jgi:hypothetical protein